MGIILMICGCIWIVQSLILNTKNFKSVIFFKVIPFFTGVATIFCAMNIFGWIHVF